MRSSLGMGILNIVTRLIGNVPAPLVFGALIDRTCAFWERKCDENAACYTYDIE